MVRCAVVGLGQLGCRIITELVSFGHHVSAYDKDHRQRDTLLQRVHDQSMQLERDGLIDTGIKFHNHVTVCSNLRDAAENAEFIFEAASENIRIKKAILKETTAACTSEAIIGTNTLTLPLEAIVDDALFNERILGIRFLYPVFGIPILEYTICAETSLEAIEKTRQFFESMGKRLVRKENVAQPLMLNAVQVENYQREFREKRLRAARNHHGAGVQTKETSPIPLQNQELKVTGNDKEDDGNTKKSEDSTDECIICNENQINAILFPCRHMWLCFPCAKQLKSRSDPCPACRANIEEVISVFKP